MSHPILARPSRHVTSQLPDLAAQLPAYQQNGFAKTRESKMCAAQVGIVQKRAIERRRGRSRRRRACSVVHRAGCIAQVDLPDANPTFLGIPPVWRRFQQDAALAQSLLGQISSIE